MERLVVILEWRRPVEVAAVGTMSEPAAEIARSADGLIEPLTSAIGDPSIQDAARGLLARPEPEGRVLGRTLVVRRSTVVRASCGDWSAEVSDLGIEANPSSRTRWARARMAGAREALGRGDLEVAERLATRAREVGVTPEEADELLSRVERERDLARHLERKARAEAERRRSWILGLAVGAAVLVAVAFAIAGGVFLVVRNRAS